MKSTSHIFFWTQTLVCFSLFAGAAKKPADSDKFQHLRELIEKTIKSSDQFSVVLGEADNLFERSPHELLIPASTTKVATALTALDVLKPGTKFHTDFVVDNPIQDGVLAGDLFFRGGGDPGFVSESLWKMVNDLTRTSLKKIKGNIVVDDQFFDHVRFDESRDDLRVERAYDAPVGALSFNWNSVNIYVRPAAKVGANASITLDPENEFTEWEGSVKTVGNSDKTDIQVERVEKSEHDLFRIHGQIRADEVEKVLYRSVTRPDLWAGYQLKSFLKNRGIDVTGKVVAGSTKSSASPLISNESKPIESMVIDMDKFSNNFVAEMLTKLIGVQTKKPGSIDEGMKAISERLDQVNGCKGEHSLVSPSGLTHRNKISTSCLWKLLSSIQQKFLLAPEYISSFPIAGVDGTMKNRLKLPVFRGSVRAKTGSIAGVVALAGYYRGTGNAAFVPFAMIYNGKQDEGKIRDFFDALLQIVLQPNGKTDS